MNQWGTGLNSNAGPAYIIIIMHAPGTVGNAGCLTSELKHRQGDNSSLFLSFYSGSDVLL